MAGSACSADLAERPSIRSWPKVPKTRDRPLAVRIIFETHYNDRVRARVRSRFVPCSFQTPKHDADSCGHSPTHHGEEPEIPTAHPITILGKRVTGQKTWMAVPFQATWALSSVFRTPARSSERTAARYHSSDSTPRRLRPPTIFDRTPVVPSAVRPGGVRGLEGS